MSTLDLGLIGNCQISALIDKNATIVWGCLPQLDSDPTFCKLLRHEDDADQPGEFGIELVGQTKSEQEYIPNTAILSTKLFDADGNGIRVTDVAPRHSYKGRMFAPMMISASHSTHRRQPENSREAPAGPKVRRETLQVQAWQQPYFLQGRRHDVSFDDECSADARC